MFRCTPHHGHSQPLPVLGSPAGRCGLRFCHLFCCLRTDPDRKQKSRQNLAVNSSCKTPSFLSLLFAPPLLHSQTARTSFPECPQTAPFVPLSAFCSHWPTLAQGCFFLLSPLAPVPIISSWTKKRRRNQQLKNQHSRNKNQ